MEVVEWFFLDWVDSQRTGFGIYLTDEYTVFVTTTTTEPRLAIGYLAMVWTELALHLSVL
jgi:hypothetical protein